MLSATIVSDSSCLILLTNIGELDILEKLYGEIIITSIIALEYKLSLPSWIKIMDPKNIEYQNELVKTIDIGEASAIALAVELVNCELILDDKLARKMATRLGLIFTGTLGVLVEAKDVGLIPLLKPLFDKIEQTDFRYTKELLEATLKSVGE
jgi:predicted nucleic acid-binding protein